MLPFFRATYSRFESLSSSLGANITFLWNVHVDRRACSLFSARAFHSVLASIKWQTILTKFHLRSLNSSLFVCLIRSYTYIHTLYFINLPIAKEFLHTRENTRAKDLERRYYRERERKLQQSVQLCLWSRGREREQPRRFKLTSLTFLATLLKFNSAGGCGSGVQSFQYVDVLSLSPSLYP